MGAVRLSNKGSPGSSIAPLRLTAVKAGGESPACRGARIATTSADPLPPAPTSEFHANCRAQLVPPSNGRTSKSKRSSVTGEDFKRGMRGARGMEDQASLIFGCPKYSSIPGVEHHVIAEGC